MKIKSLLIMPGKEVQIVKIPGNIKFIKNLIGNELKMFKATKDTIIITNKNAPFDEFNRFFKGNIILGTFIVVSFKNHHRVSMSRQTIDEFSHIFSLRKHQNKITRYKEDFLEEYYYNKKKMKENNAKMNKKYLFKNIA